MNLELFSCAGGMAKGFADAGVHFDMVVDWDADACASYEANLGHRPMRMDARDLLGFPRRWKFTGKTKKARWSQIGMAMPPPLARAVATAIVAARGDVVTRRQVSRRTACGAAEAPPP